jgi:hypothetical protein
VNIALVRYAASAVVLGATLYGCSSDEAGPSAPAMHTAPRLTTGELTQTAAVLTRLKPLAKDLAVSKVIDQKGGTLDLPGTGLKVIVPANAIAGKTTFTVTAYAGRLVAYDFQPHGTQFAVPLRVEQGMKGTNADHNPEVQEALAAGYFADSSSLDEENDAAVVEEVLPVETTITKDKIKFSVEHFSGYLIATGRMRTY